MSAPSLFSVRAAVTVAAMTGLFLLLSTYAKADEVTDSIKEATDAYEAGDNTTALESLNYAVQLIQQLKGKGLEAMLPTALDGWTAEEAESSAVGAAMFGGGVTAERRYRKGDSSLSVQIVTDSPMLQGMMVLFSNPMFANSSGGKMEKVAGQKAIVTYDSSKQEGDYKIAVANRYLVTVSGNGVSKDDLKAYAGAIDFKKME